MVFSGIIGVIVRNSYSYFAREIGLAQFYIWNLGASLMVETAQIGTIFGHIVGFLIDLFNGSIFGVMIGLLLHLTGHTYYILKGWGVGLLAWMFFYGILYHNLPFTAQNAPADALSNLSAFIGHSIFGIVTAVAYVKIFAKNLETNKDTGQKEATVSNTYS